MNGRSRVACFLLFAVVACTQSKGAASGGGSCGELGGACAHEGQLCSPAPIGTGWSHALTCSDGKWTEMEIAPLPTPAVSSSASSR
jgi:hypothetical protein